MPDLDYVVDQLVKVSGAIDRHTEASTLMLEAVTQEIERLWADVADLRDEIHKVAGMRVLEGLKS